MDFLYSEVIDSTTYKTNGLCDGIDLRRNRDPMGENVGAIRCQKDWSRFVGPVKHFKGTLGTPFSFIRVSIPESQPDRLEIISYANEFAFLYDDVIMEHLDQSLGSQSREHLIDDFSKADLSSSNAERPADGAASRSKGVKQIQAQILSEMMGIDKERGLTTMKSWQKFVEVVATRQRSEPFAGLHEYLPYRISDAGELFWFGLVTFAMALTIPEEEIGLCKRLGHPAWAALALTNDLFSWEKERDEAAKIGSPHVMNAIWVIMREHSATEQHAKEICQQKIKEYVAEAIRVVHRTKDDSKLSLDLRRYTEAILYSISGNLVWSIYCPRYHPEASYDNVVLSMMAEVAQDQGKPVDDFAINIRRQGQVA